MNCCKLFNAMATKTYLELKTFPFATAFYSAMYAISLC